MTLQLHDTLSGHKKTFQTQEANHARIYVCGPTVYDFAHLGHARCYVAYDVLVRHLRASGMKVTYVRNVTDVDDKILNRSKENGETPVALSERFYQSFLSDLDSLSVERPDIEPKVSDHLPEIIALIARLIENGAAYASKGDVYFRVAKFESYGKLSNRPAASLLEGASGRVGDDESSRKENAADFALWKGCEESEWGWTSPWGFGRPGWHIECSAMSMKHLGETFDLHGGGLDLVFPHHENEIAQSEAATHCSYCNHWMHNGFVEVDKTKMSKSLGNFFTVKDLVAKHNGEALRLAMMSVHYRSPLSLDWELDEQGNVTRFPLFEDTERRVEYLYSTAARLAEIDAARLKEESVLPASLQGFETRLKSALDDDLNMPVALAHMHEALRGINELAELAKKKNQVGKNAIAAAQSVFEAVKVRLGLGSQEAHAFLRELRDRRAAEKKIEGTWVMQKLAERTEARARKDFAAADQIRAELAALDIEIMDSDRGTDWTIKRSETPV